MVSTVVLPTPDEGTLTALAQDLDSLKAETLAKVGDADAKYIRRVHSLQFAAEWLGRASLVAGFWWLWLWPVGVLLLALSKILDNMELGHNIMHGQYNWMNDPVYRHKNFEWDIACDGGSWRRVHNYEHHTYTNILGKDRDFGYGLLRLSSELPWRVKNSWQLITYFWLSVLFQWGVSYHELAAERVFFGKRKAQRHSKVTPQQLKRAFFGKGARQIGKDYVLFPLLAGPAWLAVLVGNLLANLLRNLWTSTIIFCGHFTGPVSVFSEQQCANESRGHWYYRQVLGSSNLEGRPWFHILTGHLSCQIEHHLFPELPSSRYQEVKPKVQAILQKYGIAYHTGGFWRQYGSVLHRIWRHSFP